MSLEPTTTPGTRVLWDVDQQREPLFHLILLDDDDHTYQYVIRLLGDIFGYSREKAFAIACMVDAEGRAILMTADRNTVEAKQEAIHAYGPDPRLERSRGSMTAILEPVE